MATVKLRLRNNKPNSKGECPIFIRIIHNRRMTEIATGKYLAPSLWDDEKERVLRKHPNYKLLNAYLNQERMAYQTIIDKKDAKQQSYSIQDILDEKNGRIISEDGEQLFTYFLEKFIEDNPENLKYNTICNYKSTLYRWRQFNRKLRVKEVNEDVLIQFERFLTKKCDNKTNTVHSRMKIVRKMIKLAYRKGYIAHDPFKNFSLKTERTKRAYLNLDELKKLESYQSTIRSHIIASETFLFACYCGIRFSDLCTLRRREVTQNVKGKANQLYRLNFRMDKTEDYLNIQLSSKAVAILMKNGFEHKQPDDLLFPILKPELDINDPVQVKKAISARGAYLNKILKRIMRKLEIEKSVSMHTARHTFATICLNLGARIEVVSKLLGHSDIKTTQIYAKIMDKEKDAAIDLWEEM